VDHFKERQRRFGHPAGDAVLRKVAALFTEALREIDVAGRLGRRRVRATSSPETDLEGRPPARGAPPSGARGQPAARRPAEDSELRRASGSPPSPSTCPNGRSSPPRTPRSTRPERRCRNRVVADGASQPSAAFRPGLVPDFLIDPLQSRAAPSPFPAPEVAACRSTHHRSLPRSSRSTWS
jgi:hypothetical protein